MGLRNRNRRWLRDIAGTVLLVFAYALIHYFFSG